MKHILFALMLVPCVLVAQDVVSDTNYIIQVNGQYYFTERYDYSDGTHYERSAFIGSPEALVARSQNRISNTATKYANAVAEASRYTRDITGAIRDAANIATQTGTNPISQLAAQNIEHYTDSLAAWTIITASGSLPFAFSTTAQGALRYRIDNGTARAVTAFGRDIIRLTGYPATGTSTDLYWDTARNRYITQGADVVIRRTRNVQR
jgi:hypothetical protein